jgi:uncharacterized membrane protein
MSLEEVLYSVGEGAERLARGAARAFRGAFFPQPSEKPPKFSILRKLVKKEVTPHELLSLELQLVFIAYLAVSFAGVFLHWGIPVLTGLYLLEILFIRWIFGEYREFFVEFEPYKVFYYGISTISFLAFAGYLILRRTTTGVYQYYAYVIAVFVVVLFFRWYFRRRFGRDYTYGVVEEVKNDLIRVFVHDDIAANVKPGYYWIPAVPDAEPGRVVKLLIEERNLRGSVPVRVLEVYLSSSQSSTEPKAETE